MQTSGQMYNVIFETHKKISLYIEIFKLGNRIAQSQSIMVRVRNIC